MKHEAFKDDPFCPPAQTVAFEKELARFFKVSDAVAVSSGTAAIHCALAVLDIGVGDEVLIPSLSVVMSVAPVLYQGATPVFVDSQRDTIDFDYQELRRKLSPRTKAIVPVYLWGCSYDMTRLVDFAQENNIAIVEDACQAHGSLWQGKYLGTWGSFGCFSMKNGKLLSTGEGGFLLTNNSELADRARAFRSHWTNPTDPALGHTRLGWNYRLTELQAERGRLQLSRFQETLVHRRWQTSYILQSLKNLSELQPYRYISEETPNYFSPVMLAHQKFANKNIGAELYKRGVANSVGTFGLRPVYEWEVFKSLRSDLRESGTMSNAKNLLNRLLAPILSLAYTRDKLDEIVGTISELLHTAGKDV